MFFCHLVVVVDHLARVDDGEVWHEVGHFRLALRPDEHVLREVVLPRQLRDDAHVFARLRAGPAVPVETYLRPATPYNVQTGMGFPNRRGGF